MSIERPRMVYVAGSGHTGSTLLALLLDTHPEIACVGETAIKPKIRRRGDQSAQRCSCGSVVPECPFWQQVARSVRDKGYEFGLTHWTNDYRFEHPVAQKVLTRACASPSGRALVRWAAGNLPLYRSRVARTDAVNVAFIQAILAVTGAKVFADTSKRLPRLLHLLRVAALDVKLVLLVRDVRGYAASAKRRGFPVVDAARTWCRDQVALAEIASHLPHERVHRVRYEDICGEPKATLSRLWTFCGVSDRDPPDVVETAHHHVLGNSMRMEGHIRIRLDQSWRQRLDSGETRGILEIAGELNRTLGYI